MLWTADAAHPGSGNSALAGRRLVFPASRVPWEDTRASLERWIRQWRSLSDRVFGLHDAIHAHLRLPLARFCGTGSNTTKWLQPLPLFRSCPSPAKLRAWYWTCFGSWMPKSGRSQVAMMRGSHCWKLRCRCLVSVRRGSPFSRERSAGSGEPSSSSMRASTRCHPCTRRLRNARRGAAVGRPCGAATRPPPRPAGRAGQCTPALPPFHHPLAAG